ncbi:hypothetical protein NC653_005277 [Populus alba x Populus x berolinensis]|uniref:Uncharacterized protein n=1 Tax=Populus alba x Populus x berolinensis TaxID=444605 RepID=A0AAD6RBI1_9ROSI|nr:hypothetical protein NC653_005277 [Populus alba x Populus x berolinensis]
MQGLSVVGVFWIVDGVCELSVTGDDDQGKLIDSTVMKVLLFNFGIIKHLFLLEFASSSTFRGAITDSLLFPCASFD